MLYLAFVLMMINAPQEALPTTKVHLPEWDLYASFPQGWQTQTENVTPMALVAQNPEHRALTLVAVNPISLNANDEKLLGDYLDGVKNNFEAFEVISKGEAQVAGVSAFHAVYIGQKGSVRIQYHSYSFHRSGDQYTVTFACNPEKSELMEPQFQAILASFEIRGPKHAPITDAFLHEVAKAQTDYAALERLLSEGADINGIGQNKVGALFSAVRNRNGKLVKWLIEKGITLEDPRQDFFMLTLIASPAIRTLLQNSVDKNQGNQAETPQSAADSGIQMQWVTKEAQLFSGIHNGNLADVQEAIAKGADLAATDDVYKLQPLPLINQIIADFRELGLDAAKYEPVKSWLVEKLTPGQNP